VSETLSIRAAGDLPLRSRMPKLDAPGCYAVRDLGNRGSIDLGDEWSLVFSEEMLDARESRHESAREIRKLGRADNN